ncbi:unnamed protein product [Anisakis simplex]|uniref:Ig-like domain-containing protein n=1 Tax=Anisakis simplex TaxID=6269 RepID=A0A0M3JKH6_ANISI|nr:unnamed protein product [Anisakis simplex]
MNYLKDGYQKLTCRSDGSGWVDQFEASITTAMSCTLGCIQRPLANDNTDRNTNKWNLNVRINGVEMSCVAAASNLTVDVKVEEPDEHGFYCKVPSDQLIRTSQNAKEDSCTNACFAIEDIPDSVVMEQVTL